MSKNDLKNKSTEQLEGQLKVIKIISSALAIVITLLLALTIYGIIKNGADSVEISLLVVAIACSAILPLQFMTMKNIKSELKLRT